MKKYNKIDGLIKRQKKLHEKKFEQFMKFSL